MSKGRLGMKKLVQVGLFAITLIIGGVFGLFIPYSLEIASARKPDNFSYECQLQYLDGSSIGDYDWGPFFKGEEKKLDCQIAYLGNATAKITWKTTNLPRGWSIEVWDLSHPKPRLWRNDTSITFQPGKTSKIQVILKEVDAEPEKQENFSLNFISMGKNR
jgi:hypothetical protein